ncbi:MAG: hypothetical protein HY071_01655 [Chloroflexi bacterium]|nr:hypothetical protein [Chloroflexota bacterium]
MRRFAAREDGQAIVMVAIFMLAMLFAVGLAIDSGQLFVAKRTQQEAADAAAFAGAVALYQGATTGSAGTAVAAAVADATLNGYTTGGTTTVTVNNPPTSGTFSGNSAYVEVTITTSVRTSLVPQESGLTTVRARGVAGNAPLNLGYAVIAVDQNCDSGTATLSSNGSLLITGGGIMINSCSATAGDNNGTVTLSPAGTYHTDVVGNATGSWPDLRTGRTVQPDPFAGYPKPSTTGLPTYSPACSPAINQPGIYTSTFNSNCDYVLAPGNYIFKGGGISLGGNSSLCNGATCITPSAAGGVFLFLTQSTYPATGGSCATLALNGNNTTTLTPPTSGTYMGMLIMYDSNCSGTLSIGGNGSITTTGTIYAPNGTIAGNGNNSAVSASQIIAKKIDTQNADFTISYSTATTAQPTVPALTE